MQTTIINTLYHSDIPARSNLVIVQFADGPLRELRPLVHDEAEASIGAREVHHQSHFIDFSNLTEDRIDHVLVDVSGYSTDEDFASRARSWTDPSRGWTAELSLSVLLHYFHLQVALEFQDVFVDLDLLAQVQERTV